MKLFRVNDIVHTEADNLFSYRWNKKKIDFTFLNLVRTLLLIWHKPDQNIPQKTDLGNIFSIKGEMLHLTQGDHKSDNIARSQMPKWSLLRCHWSISPGYSQPVYAVGESYALGEYCSQIYKLQREGFIYNHPSQAT